MTSSLKILKCPEELTNRHSILVVLVCSLVDHGPKHQFPASRPAHWPIWIQHGHRGEHHYFVHRWIKAIYHPQIDHRSHSPYSIWVIYIYIDHVHHITQLYPIIIIIPCFFTTEKTCFTHWLKDHKGPCYPPNDLPGGRAPCIWKQTQEAGGKEFLWQIYPRFTGFVNLQGLTWTSLELGNWEHRSRTWKNHWADCKKTTWMNGNRKNMYSKNMD